MNTFEEAKEVKVMLVEFAKDGGKFDPEENLI